jgi:ElaB/YqjD/DUF883 family membrane-anchored ribosome-binding protein
VFVAPLAVTLFQIGNTVTDMSDAGERAGEAVAGAADKVSDAASQAGGQAREFLDGVEAVIRDNPWLAVLAATVAGYTWARLRH